MAKQTVDNLYRKAWHDFRGGINNLNSQLTIQPNQFTECDNFVVNDTGLIERAKGYIKDGSPFGTTEQHFIRMLTNFKRGTTVDKLVMAAYDSGNANATYRVDFKETAGDGSYDYIGYTVGTATFTQTSATVEGQSGTAWATHIKAGDKIKPSGTSVWYEVQSVTDADTLVLTAVFAEATQSTSTYKIRVILHKDFIPASKTFNNKLVITNGSETPLTYDNTNVLKITDSDVPSGKFIETHKNRVFIAATSGGPSTLFWSAVNDEATWDAASYDLVNPQDNGNICAIKSFSDSLIVFKDNGNIYQVAGSFDQDAVGEWDYCRKIDTPENIGIVAGQTVAVGDDGNLLFLTETGVYSLDRRLQLTKVSWNVDETVRGMSFQLGPTSSKSYLYDDVTHWDAGTHSGTRANAAGTLSNIFDDYTITDAYKNTGCCAVGIDTSNVIHTAYVSDSTRTVIKYAYWTVAGVKATETVYTSTTGNISSLRMSVAPDGSIAVAFIISDGGYGTVYCTIRNAGTGVWGATSQDTAAVSTATNDYIIRYNAASALKYAVFRQNFSAVGNPIELAYGNFGTVGAVITSISSSSVPIRGTDLFFNTGSSPSVSCYMVGSLVVASYSSADGGTTFSANANVAVTTAPTMANTSYAHNSIDDKLIVYGDNGAIKKRNLTATTTTTLDSTTDKVLWYTQTTDRQAWLQIDSTGTEKFNYESSYTTGTASFTNGSTAVVGTSTYWLANVAVGDTIKITSHADSVYATVLLVNSNTSITLSAVYGGSTTSGGYTAKRLSSITNPTASTAETLVGTGVASGRNNTVPTYAFCLFGANASEILVRRITPKAVWTSDERSDSTLTAWGTYEVGSQAANGNTIAHEVALNTSSPATVYATINPGAIISTDATKIFVIAKISVYALSWASSTIGSITLNFTGSGIDARRPVGVVFENQYYVAYTNPAGIWNNSVLVYDKSKSFVTNTHTVGTMTRYKNKLYAGASHNGDLYIILQNYLYNTSTYTCNAISKEDMLGSLELEKDIYKAYVIFETQSSGEFTFSYRLNYFTDSTTDWTNVVIDQTADGIAEIPINSKARSIQFRVRFSDVGCNIGVVGWVLLYGYLHTR